VTPQQNVRTVSIDEMTGVQALERTAPDLPMRPGDVVRREFEYIRQGTQTPIADFDVPAGQVIGSVGETRTELDYVPAFWKPCLRLPGRPRAGTWSPITLRGALHFSRESPHPRIPSPALGRSRVRSAESTPGPLRDSPTGACRRLWGVGRVHTQRLPTQ
jgi:hypothetical protein